MAGHSVMAAHVHVGNVQIPANTSHFKIPDIFRHIPKAGKLCGCSPWKVFLLKIVVSILSIIIPVLNFYGGNGSVVKISGSGMLIPHTSLTVPVSGLYCESFVLSRFTWDNSEAAVSWNAAVYIVPKKTPPPSDHFNFTMSSNVTLDASNRWYMRYAYLHSGSKVVINSCAQQGAQKLLRACIVQGKGGFKEWLSNLYDCNGSHMFEYELDTCTRSTITRDYHFPVEEDNTYYFVHYAVTNSSAIHHLTMNISISSLDYVLDNISFSCTTDYYNSCTTPNIPIGFRGLALITAVVEKSRGSSSWSYEDTISVSWKCNASFRGYLLVFGIPFFCGSFACFILCILFITCSRRYGCCSRIRARSMTHSVQTSVSLSKPCQQQQSSSHRDSSYLAQHCGNKVRCYFFVVFCSCLILVPVIASLCTFIEGIIPVLIAYSAMNNIVLTPGGTHSFAVNKFFCSSVSVGVIGSSHLSASIWITDAEPQLTQSSNVLTRKNFVCDKPSTFCYMAWRPYIHRNSTLQIKAANYSKGAVFIKRFFDEDSFQNFLQNPTNRSASILSVKGTKYKKLGDQIIALFAKNEAAVNISLDFTRTEFSTSKLSHLSYCELHSYTKTNCKLPIPFGHGNVTGVLEVKSDENFSNLSYHWEYLTVSTECNFRADTWSVLWLPILIVNISFWGGLFVFVSWLCYKWKVRNLIRRHADRGSRPVSSADATAEAAPVTTTESGNTLVTTTAVYGSIPASPAAKEVHTAVAMQGPVATSSMKASSEAVIASAVSSEVSGATANTPPTTIDVGIGSSSEVARSSYERLQVVCPVLTPVAMSNEASTTTSMHTPLAEDNLTVFEVSTSETDPLLPQL